MLATQLVRAKKQQERMYQTKAQMGGMAATATSMGSQLTMVESMKTGVEVMKVIGDQMDPLEVRLGCRARLARAVLCRCSRQELSLQWSSRKRYVELNVVVR